MKTLLRATLVAIVAFWAGPSLYAEDWMAYAEVSNLTGQPRVEVLQGKGHDVWAKLPKKDQPISLATFTVKAGIQNCPFLKVTDKREWTRTINTGIQDYEIVKPIEHLPNFYQPIDALLVGEVESFEGDKMTGSYNLTSETKADGYTYLYAKGNSTPGQTAHDLMEWVKTLILVEGNACNDSCIYLTAGSYVRYGDEVLTLKNDLKIDKSELNINIPTEKSKDAAKEAIQEAKANKNELIADAKQLLKRILENSEYRKVDITDEETYTAEAKIMAGAWAAYRSKRVSSYRDITATLDFKAAYPIEEGRVSGAFELLKKDVDNKDKANLIKDAMAVANDFYGHILVGKGATAHIFLGEDREPEVENVWDHFMEVNNGKTEPIIFTNAETGAVISINRTEGHRTIVNYKNNGIEPGLYYVQTGNEKPYIVRVLDEVE